MERSAPHNQKEAVRNLQRYLRALSFDHPEIPRAPIDGIFDTVTADALKGFQAAYALPITGRADPVTWARLYEEYEKHLAKTVPPPAVQFFPVPPIGYEIELFEESLTVFLLQLILKELTVVYDDLLDEPITGRYGEITAKNVRSFQRRSLLPETGRVDLTTWNRLLRDYENHARPSE